MAENKENVNDTVTYAFIDRVFTPCGCTLLWYLTDLFGKEETRDKAGDAIGLLLKNVGLSFEQLKPMTPDDKLHTTVRSILSSRDLNLNYDDYLLTEDVGIEEDHVIICKMYEMLFGLNVTGYNPVVVVYTNEFEKAVFEMLVGQSNIPKDRYSLAHVDSVPDMIARDGVVGRYGIEVVVSGVNSIVDIIKTLSDNGKDIKVKTIHIPIFGGDRLGEDFPAVVLDAATEAGVSITFVPNLELKNTTIKTEEGNK